ncbi:MAG: hypothetical protein KC431_09145, partial [Myxococcales bacterium]|nr:hypothetical protein [Myxococcales bacterium]
VGTTEQCDPGAFDAMLCSNGVGIFSCHADCTLGTEWCHCEAGLEDCQCKPGNLCLAGLTCEEGVCVGPLMCAGPGDACFATLPCCVGSCEPGIGGQFCV